MFVNLCICIIFMFVLVFVFVCLPDLQAPYTKSEANVWALTYTCQELLLVMIHHHHIFPQPHPRYPHNHHLHRHPHNFYCHYNPLNVHCHHDQNHHHPHHYMKLVTITREIRRSQQEKKPSAMPLVSKISGIYT